MVADGAELVLLGPALQIAPPAARRRPSRQLGAAGATGFPAPEDDLVVVLGGRLVCVCHIRISRHLLYVPA